MLLIAFPSKAAETEDGLYADGGFFITKPLQQPEADQLEELVVDGVERVDDVGDYLGGAEADDFVFGCKEGEDEGDDYRGEARGGGFGKGSGFWVAVRRDLVVCSTLVCSLCIGDTALVVVYTFLACNFQEQTQEAHNSVADRLALLDA